MPDQTVHAFPRPDPARPSQPSTHRNARRRPAAALATAAVLGLLAAAPARAEADIAFGPDPRQRLDIYRAAPGCRDVAVFLYGGGWEGGDRGFYRFVGQALAARGVTTVIPDYRVYPQVVWPDFLRDNAAAVRWVVDHIAEHGGDPGRIVLVGHSAGAYDAAMLALDKRWLGEVGLDPDRAIRRVVGLAGPYDFLPLVSPVLKTIFGPEAQLPDTQPITHARAGAPPMFLAAGMDDDTVLPRNSVRLAARLTELGGSARLVEYPRIGHKLLIGAFAWPLRFAAPVLDDTVAFIRNGEGDGCSG